ncbi:hypothetical protein TNCV_2057981 [Trichonephila clavipes]|nr:hypothetical protein TNCV_2057981 [Trichonephila clavipes]
MASMGVIDVISSQSDDLGLLFLQVDDTTTDQKVFAKLVQASRHLDKEKPMNEGASSVPTNDVINQVFIESSALEQVVAIHSGMATEWSGLVSSHTKLLWRYTPKKSCPVVRRKRATASALSSYLGIRS